MLRSPRPRVPGRSRVTRSSLEGGSVGRLERAGSPVCPQWCSVLERSVVEVVVVNGRETSTVLQVNWN